MNQIVCTLIFDFILEQGQILTVLFNHSLPTAMGSEQYTPVTHVVFDMDGLLLGMNSVHRICLH